MQLYRCQLAHLTRIARQSLRLIGVCTRKLWLKMQSVQKDEEKTKNLFQTFACLYLGIGWHNLLQIWYVDLPSSGASQQQIWLNLGK